MLVEFGLPSKRAKHESELLVDGGYNQHKALDEAAALDVTVYAPLPKRRKVNAAKDMPQGAQADALASSGNSSPVPPALDPHLPRDTDSEAVAAWRRRMGTDEAQQIYKQRAATAETVNADAKAHRGLDHLVVRGLTKVLGVASLFALTYDILRVISLRG